MYSTCIACPCNRSDPVVIEGRIYLSELLTGRFESDAESDDRIPRSRVDTLQSCAD